MSNEEEKNITTDQEALPETTSRRTLFKILGLLIVVGIIGYVVYYQFTNIMAVQSAHGKQKIQQIQASVAELENMTQTQQKTLQVLTEDFNQLKQNQATSEQNPSRHKDMWLAAEVNYLVKLANINLEFRQSVSQALVLLKLADQNIRDTRDPVFAEVRKALAADIVDLESTQEVDKTGIYMRLLALNGKVDQLPLMNKPTVATGPTQTTTPSEDLPWWRKGLKQSLETLQKLVVVRYSASGKIPLVPPDQQAYLYQNWHVVLLHAMTALMQGESEIYHSSLQQIITWINEYAMPDTPVVNAFLAELSQLQAINIHPVIPKMSRSLQAVETLTVS
jgi:uroporphyrin-3 C-methyltransferase